MTIRQDFNDGTLVVEPEKNTRADETEKSQMVLSLNMRALKGYLSTLRDSKPDRTPALLHREDDLYKAADAQAQAELLDKRKSQGKETESHKRKQAKTG